jgi:hypothetical protein
VSVKKKSMLTDSGHICRTTSGMRQQGVDEH